MKRVVGLKIILAIVHELFGQVRILSEWEGVFVRSIVSFTGLSGSEERARGGANKKVRRKLKIVDDRSIIISYILFSFNRHHHDSCIIRTRQDPEVSQSRHGLSL